MKDKKNEEEKFDIRYVNNSIKIFGGFSAIIIIPFLAFTVSIVLKITWAMIISSIFIGIIYIYDKQKESILTFFDTISYIFKDRIILP